jgi:hypothetical protein
VLAHDLVTVGIAGTHSSRHDGLEQALAKATLENQVLARELQVGRAPRATP